MPNASDPAAADRRFFRLLIENRVDDLKQFLTEDFILIDVMQGSEVPRAALLDVLAARQLEFLAIEPAEVRVRRYPGTAIVTGRTEMQGRFQGEPFTAQSRYTHVYIEDQGHWRLAAAQGTPIVRT